jgi:hypothetical protein
MLTALYIPDPRIRALYLVGLALCAIAVYMRLHQTRVPAAVHVLRGHRAPTRPARYLGRHRGTPNVHAGATMTSPTPLQDFHIADDELTPTELLDSVVVRPEIRVPTNDAIADDVHSLFERVLGSALAESRQRLDWLAEAEQTDEPLRHFRTMVAAGDTQHIDLDALNALLDADLLTGAAK